MLANRLLIIEVDALTLSFPPRLNSSSHSINCLIKKHTVLHEFYMIHWEVSYLSTQECIYILNVYTFLFYLRYGVAHSLVFSVSFLGRLGHF